MHTPTDPRPMATPQTQGRSQLSGLGLDTQALERLGGGVFSLDRVEIASGVSERGPVANSEWRLLIEKEIPEPWELTFIGEIPLSRYGEYYWAVERNLNRNFYGTLFWASAQEGRSLFLDGAAGADFKMRWDLEY